MQWESIAIYIRGRNIEGGENPSKCDWWIQGSTFWLNGKIKVKPIADCSQIIQISLQWRHLIVGLYIKV